MSLPLVVAPKVVVEAAPLQSDKKSTDIEEQLDLLRSEEELERLRALDEVERLRMSRHHGIRQKIPL
jgi:hypothetical protein